MSLLVWGTLIVIIGACVFVGYHRFRYGHFPWQKASEEEEVSNRLAELSNAELDSELQSIPGAIEIKKIARVGNEYLFITDLDYYARGSLSAVEEIDRDAAIDALARDSIILQAGKEEGWIELDSEVFHNPFKDFIKRGELIMKVEENFDSIKKEQTIVEMIAVWFLNVSPGELAQTQGMEAAKSFAKEKVDNAYHLVKEEGKTMQEVGEMLANDESLAQLDKNYENNAYGEMLLPYEISEDFQSEILKSFIESANEGEVSQIYLETGKTEEGEEVEIRYVFYKLKSRQEGFEDFVNWIDDFKKGVTIDIYNF